jgi:hypothetical protein
MYTIFQYIFGFFSGPVVEKKDDDFVLVDQELKQTFTPLDI